ncbi:pentapeptide repeats family protein [Orientia chuto str. Dubai]|uniref:Pentapeptide repeats family protein n=1 Tax=Orientia chuto str. Dubai TaxID=1359168 RepID=A0A0F3MN69_9RICK|nr:pentapeptide repeat-containing protein [Candidatus Orientia mediorientalis]KJV56917.1 pentapeptide repeats family protein [Orientia chuto str. Dubai]
MNRILQIDVCLSKQLKAHSYALLQNAFEQNNNGFTVDHRLNLKSLQKNLDLYLENEDFRSKMEEQFGYSDKNRLKMVISQIPTNSAENENYELDSKYLKLQKGLRKFLYEPEDGIELLLEYQEKCSNEQTNIPFNDFLSEKLKNVKNISELAQSPSLYRKITSSYKDIESLHKDLQNSTVVANICHKPQVMADGTQQMLNDDFLFDEVPTVDFQTHILTGTEDFQPGANECRKELFNGGNFQGSTFRNIEFDFSPEDINFRNCLFDTVAFSNHSIKNLDLRGVKLQKLLFSNNGLIDNVFFDVQDHKVLKQLGVLRLEQSVIEEQVLRQNNTQYYTEDKYTQDLQDLTKRTAEKLAALKPAPATGWYGSSIFSYVQSAMNYLQSEKPSIQTLQVSIEKNLQEIEAELQKSGKQDPDYSIMVAHYNQLQNLYHANKRRQQQEVNAAKEVTITNVVNDPTYCCNQSEDQTYKVKIKVNRHDLEEFIKKGAGQSCCEFLSNKYASDIQNKKNSIKEEIGATDIKIVMVPDFSGENLSGLDFSDKNMSALNLAYCDLTFCKFSKANLDSSCLEGAKVTGASFYKANLNNANLIKVSGSGAIFDKAKGNNVRLMGAELGTVTNGVGSVPATFKGAQLFTVDSSFADMSGCNMEAAILEQADFSQANMMGVKAIQAQMPNSTFEQAVASSINLSNSNLTNSSFKEAEMINANCSKTILQDACLKQADARLATFDESNMKGVIATEANFTEAKANKISAQNANFEGAIMECMQMNSANLANANMSKVQAREASFNNANLTSVNAQQSNFVAASFMAANLNQMNIEGSNLSGSDLRDANLKDVIFSPTTILVDSNIEGAENVSEELKQHIRDQDQRLLTGLGLNSRYPRCTLVDTDGVNMRLKAQRLAYALLVSMPKEAVSSLPEAIKLLLPKYMGFSALGTRKSMRELIDSLIFAIEHGDEGLPLSAQDKKVGYIDSAYGDWLAYVGANAQAMISNTLAECTNLKTLIGDNWNKEGFRFVIGDGNQSVVSKTLTNISSKLLNKAWEGILQKKINPELPETRYAKASKIWNRKIPMVKHLLNGEYIKLLAHTCKEFWRESKAKTRLAVVGAAVGITTAAIVCAVPASLALLSYKTVKKLSSVVGSIKNKLVSSQSASSTISQIADNHQAKNTGLGAKDDIADVDLEVNHRGKIADISKQDLEIIRNSIDSISFIDETIIIPPLSSKQKNRSVKQK